MAFYKQVWDGPMIGTAENTLADAILARIPPLPLVKCKRGQCVWGGVGGERCVAASALCSATCFFVYVQTRLPSTLCFAEMR